MQSITPFLLDAFWSHVPPITTDTPIKCWTIKCKKKEKKKKTIKGTTQSWKANTTLLCQPPAAKLICKPCNFRKLTGMMISALLGLNMLNQPSSSCQFSLKKKPNVTSNVKLRTFEWQRSVHVKSQPLNFL